MNLQLTTEQDIHRSPAELLQDIILERTDRGRRIVDFLLSAMEGEFADFKPCHMLEAARLLEKYGYGEARSFIKAAQPATRRERRDSRRADRRIHSELAQIVREKTDNGATMVTFLLKAMEGEHTNFKPCHRMSACRELLHRGFDYTPEDQDGDEAEPALDPAEEEEYRRRREEAVEFSLHGPVYYDVHPFPCACEDRLHDCEGNELSEEAREEAARKPPGKTVFIDEASKLTDFRAGYAEYLTRLNPGEDLDFFFNNIRWHTPDHDP